MKREIKFMAYIKALKWTVPVTVINFLSKTVEVTSLTKKNAFGN